MTRPGHPNPRQSMAIACFVGVISVLRALLADSRRSDLSPTWQRVSQPLLNAPPPHWEPGSTMSTSTTTILIVRIIKIRD